MKKFWNNTINSWKHIPYTWRHYKAVLALQYLYMGKIKYKFHDLDKICLFIFFPWLGPKKIKEIHRKWSKHHRIGGCPEESLFDWESARFTKPDKQLNAVDTCRTFKRDWWDTMEPYFKKYGLLNDKTAKTMALEKLDKK